MDEMNIKELIYDWNKHEQAAAIKKAVFLNDETLRDGLQSPSITDPCLEDKLKLIHLMEELGIHGADIGLPGAGPKPYEHAMRIAKEIADCKMDLEPNCACRTVEADIKPIIDISQKCGINIEASTFIGSSPIRQFAEGWDLDLLLKLTEKAVSFAINNGVSVMYVTEDTTRARPETVRKLYTTAIEAGARRVCVCDTVGHATPEGAKKLIEFVAEVVKETGEDVAIDWHGHRDRGLDLVNALAAIEGGVDRIHGTGLGIGERVGNLPMDLLMVNLKLLGYIDQDITKLRDYCELVSRACGRPITNCYPVFGQDAFCTGTGVHAAAIIKAQRKGEDWLADRIYSGVPASMVGYRQVIEIGPMSGESNVIYWLRQRNVEPEPQIVKKIFEYAKQAKTILTNDDIYAALKDEPQVVEKLKTYQSTN